MATLAAIDLNSAIGGGVAILLCVCLPRLLLGAITRGGGPTVKELLSDAPIVFFPARRLYLMVSFFWFIAGLGIYAAAVAPNRSLGGWLFLGSLSGIFLALSGLLIWEVKTTRLVVSKERLELIHFRSTQFVDLADIELVYASMTGYIIIRTRDLARLAIPMMFAGCDDLLTLIQGRASRAAGRQSA